MVDVVNSIVGITKMLSISAVAVSSIVLICMYIYGVTESTFMLVTKAVLMFISGIIYTAIPSDILGIVLRTNFGSPGMTILAWSTVAAVVGVFGFKLLRRYKGMMWVSPKEVDCASNS